MSTFRTGLHLALAVAMCVALAHSVGRSWCGVINSPSSGDHFCRRYQTAPWETFAATRPSSQITWHTIPLVCHLLREIMIVFQHKCWQLTVSMCRCSWDFHEDTSVWWSPQCVSQSLDTSVWWWIRHNAIGCEVIGFRYYVNWTFAFLSLPPLERCQGRMFSGCLRVR